MQINPKNYEKIEFPYDAIATRLSGAAGIFDVLPTRLQQEGRGQTIRTKALYSSTLRFASVAMVTLLMIMAPTLLGNDAPHQKGNLEPLTTVESVVEPDPMPQTLDSRMTIASLDEMANHQDESEQKDEKSLPPYHYIILQAADRHDIDPALIRAIIMAESAYDPNAVSRSGAKGLMQLMPRTAKALGVKDILNPEHNINGGVKYIRQMLNRFNGDLKLALAAYNAGSRHVKNYRGVPPFKETRNYIKKVLNYYATYRKEMA